MSSVVPVTVVMPTYNGERYIGEALQSVYEQTVGVAEVIVVDDGSSDSSRSIAETFGARVICQPNGGVAAARNTGVNAASQPWIAFLDQDDIWEPEKIQEQWEAIQLCSDAGVVGCDFSQFKEGNVTVPSFLYRPESNYKEARKSYVATNVSHFPKLERDYFDAGFFLFPSAVIARRELLLSVGLFDPRFNSIDEADCFQRVLARSSLVVVERVLMRYRVHEDNASRDSLKILMGYIGIAKKMVANPQIYPPAGVESCLNGLPHVYFEAGRILIHKQRLHEAREMFAESLTRRVALFPCALWLSTWLGPANIDRLLRAKQRMGKRYLVANTSQGAGLSSPP